jgi:hypothetical protein
LDTIIRFFGEFFMSGNSNPNWVLILGAGIGAAGAIAAAVIGLSKPPDKPTEKPIPTISGDQNPQINGNNNTVINNNTPPTSQRQQLIPSPPTSQRQQLIPSPPTSQPPQLIPSSPTPQPPQLIPTDSSTRRSKKQETKPLQSPSPTSTSPPTPHVPLLPEPPDKDFVTIIGSYDKQEDAKMWGEKIKGGNPDLDIQVFVPSKNSNYAVSAAFSSSEEEAMKICRIARSRGIAKDAYVSSASNSYMPCS